VSRRGLADLPSLAELASLGLTLALCVSAAAGAGIGVDHWWGIAPWGLLIGLLLGIVSAVAIVVKIARRWL
jgi:F0F1-type ATP synthase assembly protein I